MCVCVAAWHWQNHFDELFPPVPEPSHEALAQAALFVVLRDQPAPSPTSPSPSPWTSLPSRRFTGDVYERTITLQTEDADAAPMSVRVRAHPDGRFDVTTRTSSGEKRTFAGVRAHLASPTAVTAVLDGALVRTTVVPQRPGPGPSASGTGERLHVFLGGRKTTVVLPAPAWLVALGGDALAGGARGALRAPMPSVVVEVKVVVGQRVEQGQAVVVLESMKTETVLRAPVGGVVRAVGCVKGEMVEEGRELVDVEEEGEGEE